MPDDIGEFQRSEPSIIESRRHHLRRVRSAVLDDDNLGDRPYSERGRLFEELHLFGPGWCTICAFVGPPQVLLDACASLDVEGVVAKQVDSPYRPGVRSGDWLKLNTAD